MTIVERSGKQQNRHDQRVQRVNGPRQKGKKELPGENKVDRRDTQRKVENRLNPTFQVEVLNADHAENAREANGDYVALLRNFRMAQLHFSCTID